MKLLIINPGSTSTKVSLFEDENLVFRREHFPRCAGAAEVPTSTTRFRCAKKLILHMLTDHNIDPSEIDAYVGRGGSAYTQPSGVTFIDKRLYDDTVAGVGGSEHPAKLGVMISLWLCNEFGGRMYTLNPTNVDELCDLARLTGIAGVYRNAQSHVLNQKAVAQAHARLSELNTNCRIISSAI